MSRSGVVRKSISLSTELRERAAVKRRSRSSRPALSRIVPAPVLAAPMLNLPSWSVQAGGPGLERPSQARLTSALSVSRARTRIATSPSTSAPTVAAARRKSPCDRSRTRRRLRGASVCSRVSAIALSPLEGERCGSHGEAVLAEAVRLALRHEDRQLETEEDLGQRLDSLVREEL